MSMSTLSGIVDIFRMNPARLISLGSGLWHFVVLIISHFVFKSISKTYSKSNQRLLWCGGIGSSIHAILATWFSIVAFRNNSYLTDWDFLRPSEDAAFANAFTAGYFAADIWISLFVGDIPTFMHHLIGGIGFFVAMEHPGLEGIILVFLYTEVSTPFVNLFWFARNVGFGPKFLTFSGLLMTLVFFLSRIVLLPWMTYMIWIHIPKIFDRFGLLPAVCISSGIVTAIILNILWFSKMISGILKHFKKPSRASVDEKKGQKASQKSTKSD